MLVKRPRKTMTDGRPSIYPYAEVRGTLDTHKAYVHRLRTRADARRIIEAMRSRLRKDGLRLGREFIKDGVLLWVERANGKGA